MIVRDDIGGNKLRLLRILALLIPLCSASVMGGDEPGSDISPELLAVRRAFMDSPTNVLIYHHMDEVFTTLPVKAGGKPWSIARANSPLNFTYEFDGVTYRPVDFYDRTFTNALLIIKNDRIVFERYRNLTKPSSHFLSMSMAKSLTSILIGAALQDGFIHSIEDQIVTYVPELRGSAFDGVTIRNALMMRTGVDREDNYQPGPDSPGAKARELTLVQNKQRARDEALTVKRRGAPGAVFSYSTLNTTVLGWVLNNAVHRSLPEYMSERLWKPLGAESDGFFLSDGPPGVGQALNGMGFNATLRDYARVGLMMLHDGKANGRQIIPSAWVKASTISQEPAPAGTMQSEGYQYQWWTLTNSHAYMAIGLQGQFIYVDPDTRTVIVKLSYFPIGNNSAEKESEAFFRAASAWRN